MSTQYEYDHAESTRNYISNPGQLAVETASFALRLKQNLLPWYFGPLDRLLNPLRRGQLIVIQARPGHGKTTFSIALANHMGKVLAALGQGNRSPLYVTRETTVQDIGMYLMAQMLSETEPQYNTKSFYRGEVDDNIIMRAAGSLANLNIHVMGQKDGTKSTEINMEHVYAGIQQLAEEDKEPAFVVLDYAQRMKPADATWRDSKPLEVGAVFENVERFCLTTGIPAILLAQSGRQVDGFDVPIGALDTIQWSSDGEQRAHTVLATVRPAAIPKWQDRGDMMNTMIDTTMGKYLNLPNLFVMRKLKERGNEAFGEIGFLFDPATLTFSELPEIETTNFNNLDSGDTIDNRFSEDVPPPPEQGDFFWE